jgi:hypothetical protein
LTILLGSLAQTGPNLDRDIPPPVYAVRLTGCGWIRLGPIDARPLGPAAAAAVAVDAVWVPAERRRHPRLAETLRGVAFDRRGLRIRRR